MIQSGSKYIGSVGAFVALAASEAVLGQFRLVLEKLLLLQRSLRLFWGCLLELRPFLGLVYGARLLGPAGLCRRRGDSRRMRRGGRCTASTGAEGAAPCGD